MDADRLPPKKPMATARRVSLYEREIRIGLSSAAVELLFQRAAVLSEGQVDAGGYFGSTMITFDCTRVSDLVAEVCDAATAKRLSELLVADLRVRDRARELGATEAQRLAGMPLGPPQVDLRVRTSGHSLHIDLDVEATPMQARAM